MSIARLGALTTASATLTSPAGQIGDLIVWQAYRSGSATAPSLPANTLNITNGGANLNAIRWAYEYATTAAGVSRTFTNATHVIATRYSCSHGIGNRGTLSSASSSTVNYPAVTLLQSSGLSWWFGGAGHRTANNVNTAPSGMTNITSVGSGPMSAVHDTNGPTSSNWSSTNVTVSASSGHESDVFELLGKNSTLNPLDIATSGITLSNSNLTFTSTATPTNGNYCRVTLPRQSGRWVFSSNPTTIGTDASGDCIFGIGIGSVGLTNSIPGSAGDGAIVFLDFTGPVLTWFFNGGSGGVTGQLQAQGVPSYLAVDLDIHKAWVRTGSNGWSGDPDGNSGGIDFATGFTAGANVYPMLGSGASGDVMVYDGTAAGHGLKSFAPWDSFKPANSSLIIPQSIQRAANW